MLEYLQKGNDERMLALQLALRRVRGRSGRQLKMRSALWAGEQSRLDDILSQGDLIAVELTVLAFNKAFIILVRLDSELR